MMEKSPESYLSEVNSVSDKNLYHDRMLQLLDYWADEIAHAQIRSAEFFGEKQKKAREAIGMMKGLQNQLRKWIEQIQQFAVEDWTPAKTAFDKMLNDMNQAFENARRMI